MSAPEVIRVETESCTCIVTVRHPHLTDAERAKREEQATVAMHNLIDEAERLKKEKEENNYGTYRCRNAG